MIQIISIIATTPPQKGDIQKSSYKQKSKNKIQKKTSKIKNPPVLHLSSKVDSPGKTSPPTNPTTKTFLRPTHAEEVTASMGSMGSMGRKSPVSQVSSHESKSLNFTVVDRWTVGYFKGQGGWKRHKARVVGYGGCCCCFFFVCVFLVVVWKHKKILGLDIIDFGGNVMKSLIYLLNWIPL